MLDFFDRKNMTKNKKLKRVKDIFSVVFLYLKTLSFEFSHLDQFNMATAVQNVWHDGDDIFIQSMADGGGGGFFYSFVAIQGVNQTERTLNSSFLSSTFQFRPSVHHRQLLGKHGHGAGLTACACVHYGLLCSSCVLC